MPFSKLIKGDAAQSLVSKTQRCAPPGQRVHCGFDTGAATWCYVENAGHKRSNPSPGGT
jgi:hypothetical protein